MLTNLLNYLNNHFIIDSRVGTTDGYKITVVNHKLLVGQYIQVAQSRLNDGTHKILSIEGNDIYVESQLLAEVDSFAVYGLAVPRVLVELATTIDYNREVKQESLGDWSATYKSWQEQYSMQLKPYKRVYSDLPFRKVKYSVLNYDITL